ncbi:MAG: extracellular solute-binding protein [Clostridiales bacterium]|nr:extracellular solute-binding protein [Clostridiales bacterium]
MKRVLSLLVILSIIVTSMMGCGKQKEASNSAPKETIKIDDSKLKDPYGLPNDYSAYPIKGNPTLTIWWPIDTFQAVAIKDMNTHEVWKEVAKMTGVNLKFISPPAGQENDQFNIMISSGELPDIIEQSDKYKGGITAGIDDKVYLDLTSIVDKYCPNYKKFRESDEMRRKTSMDDKGRVTGFYNLSPYSEWIWFGLLIKQEALDKTGLPVPETVDEWTTFLKKCKEAGYSQPLNYGSNYGQIFTGLINGAYGAYDWTYVDDSGKIQWGPIQPGAKPYLELMREWYKDGLINKDFTTADFNRRMAEATSKDTAVIMDSPDTMWGVWKTGQNNIDFVGAPYPVLKKGDKPTSTYFHWKNGGWPASITTSCKNVEAAAKFLDFGYTKKGWEIYNWGLENRTHKIDDKGMPYYQDDSIMYHDPDNIPLSNLVWKYKLHQGPFIRDEHHANPLLVAKGSYSGKIREQWQNTTDFSHAVPPLSLTTEESAREAQIGTQLSTLRGETFTKIITGSQPLSGWDDFVSKAKKMGSDEFISIWQKALDRYNKR